MNKKERKAYNKQYMTECRKKDKKSYMKEYMKEYRLKNKKKRNVYAREYNKKYARKNKIKQILVDYKGGACQICGLRDNCLSIYEFHHIDPSNKEGQLQSMSIKKQLEEVDKCIMLCANCHRRIHNILNSINNN